MSLKAVRPYTAALEAGLVHILAEANVGPWIEANAAELLAQGYVNVVVDDYVPTRAFGDKRSRR